MFISNKEKSQIKYRLDELDESVNDHAFKLSAIESVLNKILKHLEPPAKKRGRPLGSTNKKVVKK